MGTARIAQANRELTIRSMTGPGDTERDVANRFAAAAEQLLPLFDQTLVYAFEVNLLEQVRRDVLGAADLAAGEIGGAVELTICFADVVEFTSLGEEIAPEELGMVAGRLEEMATAVAEAPVRLVKTIGDAAMLVSAEAEPLVGAALDLIAARRSRRRPVPAAARRPRHRPDPAAVGRLLRPLGQPRQPDHRHRPPRRRPRRHGDPRGRRRGLPLLPRRRAPPQGHRGPDAAVPGAAGAEAARAVGQRGGPDGGRRGTGAWSGGVG